MLTLKKKKNVNIMKYLYFSALGLKSLHVVRKHTLILSPTCSFQDKQCTFVKHKSIVSDLMPFFFLKKKKAGDRDGEYV